MTNEKPSHDHIEQLAARQNRMRSVMSLMKISVEAVGNDMSISNDLLEGMNYLMELNEECVALTQKFA